MSLPGTLRRALLRLRDRLRFHPATKAAVSRWYGFRAEQRCKKDPYGALELWSAAARLAGSDSDMRAIESRVSAMLDGLSLDALWELAPAERCEVTVKKAAILKPWNEGKEKGVL